MCTEKLEILCDSLYYDTDFICCQLELNPQDLWGVLYNAVSVSYCYITNHPKSVVSNSKLLLLFMNLQIIWVVQLALAELPLTPAFSCVLGRQLCWLWLCSLLYTGLGWSQLEHLSSLPNDLSSSIKPFWAFSPGSGKDSRKPMEVCKTSWGIGSELAQHHVCHFLYTRESCKKTASLGRGVVEEQTLPLDGRNVKVTLHSIVQE